MALLHVPFVELTHDVQHFLVRHPPSRSRPLTFSTSSRIPGIRCWCSPAASPSSASRGLGPLGCVRLLQFGERNQDGQDELLPTGVEKFSMLPPKSSTRNWISSLFQRPTIWSRVDRAAEGLVQPGDADHVAPLDDPVELAALGLCRSSAPEPDTAESM